MTCTKNGTLLGTRSVAAWQYYASGGYIGVWFADSTDALLDDFGGGTVTSGATATPTSTNTPTKTPTPSNTPTKTNTPAATNTPTKTPTPSATFTPSYTPTFTPTATFTPLPTPTQPPAFTSATFVYDGDGKQVKSVINGVTTIYVGAHYHVENGVVVKYYFAGATRIAMRKNGTLSYLLGDHLGSTSITTDASGNMLSNLKYKAWGETRYAYGSIPTNYKYTGQREEAGFGLYFYNARWYDPLTGRFAQADTIVPSGIQGLDRYAYVNNAPMKYVDPKGHTPILLLFVFALLLASCSSPPEQYTLQQEYEAFLGAGEYQIAIELAVSVYEMDTSNVNGTIEFAGDDENDPILDYPDIGITTPYRNVYINETDADSPGLFASDLIHEIAHANQIANGISYLDENGNIMNQQGFLLNEYQAYTEQYLWALEHNLPSEDIAKILERRDLIYNQMQADIKDLADQGIYTLPDVTPSKPR